MVCVMEYNLLPWTCIHPSFYIDIHLTTHPINALRSPMHAHALGGLYTSLCIIMLKRGYSWNLFSSEAVCFVWENIHALEPFMTHTHSVHFHTEWTWCEIKTTSMKTPRWTVCKYEYISKLRLNMTGKWVQKDGLPFIIHYWSTSGFFIMVASPGGSLPFKTCRRECLQMCCRRIAPSVVIFVLYINWKIHRNGRFFSRGNYILLCALLWLAVM